MTTQHTKQELGKPKKVEDIKEIWPTEDSHFTPWLFDNIDLLSEALDLELEAEQQQVPVGRFWLDLLASEVGTDTDRPVVIENQFGQANHSHLGQLLTYAAGFDAKVAVWIAEGFHEEHRAALELLNKRTDEDTEFYGVTIAAWKINDSPPAAPRFDVVVTPSSRAKQVKKPSAVSPLGKKYMEFFQPLVDTLRDEHNFHNRTTATDRSWENFPSGYAGLIYNPVIGKKTRRVELYLYKNKDWNEKVFDELHKQKDSIEKSDLGKLHWQRLDDKIACRISITRDGGIDDEKMHGEIRNWMVDRLLKFKEVFGPRLAELAKRGIL